MQRGRPGTDDGQKMALFPEAFTVLMARTLG